MTQPIVKIVKAAGVEIEWQTFLAGTEALKKSGKTLPNELMASFNSCKVVLKGPITTPVGEGRGIANPTAMIMAATMMLRHISERKAADAISGALGQVRSRGECLTPDLGGRATTAQFGDAVIRELERPRPARP